ncbi:phosphoribosyltransferase [Nocardia amikacinitolerans]|uniref:phosphoribosyltransferase n=1 Tax=Nocardia amikacinitolerans TaxID=756689 RepID=UPI0020A3A63C|nr:phosphoribosyltransferase [Nocardia amikacinitolerans]
MILLTYAQGYHPGGRHQSAHEMRAYKDVPLVERCRQNLRLVVKAAVALHRSCFAQHAGSHWDAITFVSSIQRTGRTHPLAELVDDILQAHPNTALFFLQPGPNVDAGRQLVSDRFVVDEVDHDFVVDRHVLILDDTWVSGASAQGAAIAVKRAGAREVTVLCIARWLRWDWPPHKPFLESLTVPYDPLACPVHRIVCQPAAEFSTTRLGR